jgi:serine/threonine protein phosphatase PrpC
MQPPSTVIEPLERPSSERGAGVATSPLGMRSFGLTDRGLVRKTNEDQFLIATLTKAVRIQQSSLLAATTRRGDQEGHIFVVADGFGGAPGGEQASAIAVESIEDFLANTLKWFFRLKGSEKENVLAEFQDAVRQADAAIFEQSAEHPELDGMGTTLTLAYSLGANLFVAHAGDSRCYLFRGSRLEQLTHDHTLAAVLAERKSMTSDEASRKHLSHIITNAVGGRSPGVHAEIHKRELRPGDVVLLATDGLTRHLSDQQIAEILAADSDPKAACERLVALAIDAGGRDNVTVVVARYESSATTATRAS